MTLSIRRRLFLDFLLVLLIGMGLVGILTWLVVKTLYLNTQRENLLAQATLTAAALEGQPLTGTSQPYSQTTNALPGIHSRFLTEQGVVIVDLGMQTGAITPPPIENSATISAGELMRRPEIQQASQGVPASAIRRVANRQVLYAAAPIRAQNGEVAGLVYLATPLPAGGLPLNLALELLGAAVAATLLASAAGTWIARRISLPIEEIDRAAERVSAGDLNRPVDVQSEISELAGLAQSFNEMTSSLNRSIQAKNAFIADVTHELRTPLTVIKGTIETLEDGALDDRQGRTALLDSMHRETDRLIRLVNDLLVLTRADAGSLRLNLQAVDLCELAFARGEHLAGLAAQNGVKILVSGPAIARARADPDRVAQVLDNILDNALRYSPRGSTVQVLVAVREGSVFCEVSDAGPGIPAQHLPFVFERFYRADSSRDRKSGGAGLGLAIVKSLVTAMGGNVSASSVEGQGAKLYFSLPAATQLPEN